MWTYLKNPGQKLGWGSPVKWDWSDKHHFKKASEKQQQQHLSGIWELEKGTRTIIITISSLTQFFADTSIYIGFRLLLYPE